MITCPFCGKTHGNSNPYLNIVCSCNSKYYANTGEWLNRNTGEKKASAKGVMKMTIGKRLKMLREENNLCQEEVSRLLGVKQQTVGRYESGELDISTDMIKVLAVFYNVSTDWIFGLTSVKEKKWDIDTDDKFISKILEMKETIMNDHDKRPKIGRPKKNKSVN